MKGHNKIDQDNFIYKHSTKHVFEDLVYNWI